MGLFKESAIMYYGIRVELHHGLSTYQLLILTLKKLLQNNMRYYKNIKLHNVSLVL